MSEAYKGIESLSQTQMFEYLYFCNWMVHNFDTLNLNYLI